jgi:hypothetical protein
MNFEVWSLGWLVMRRAIVPGASTLYTCFQDRPKVDVFQVSWSLVGTMPGDERRPIFSSKPDLDKSQDMGKGFSVLACSSFAIPYFPLPEPRLSAI